MAKFSEIIKLLQVSEKNWWLNRKKKTLTSVPTDGNAGRLTYCLMLLTD